MKNKLLYILGIFFIVMFAFSSCEMFGSKTEENGTVNVYPEPVETTLTIRNQSFFDLSEVSWNDEDFEENSFENSINMGRSVTKNVSPGIGYIYFKRDTGAVVARTDEVITVNEGDNIEFTFTDNTIILEKNNTDNKGTLSSLESKIVFFDDAEGELQPYDELLRDVFYYSQSEYSTGWSGYSLKPRKNGSHSIAIGGTSYAGIILTVDMKYPGEISFWYATSDYRANLEFIVDEEILLQVGSRDWSFRTFPLSEGLHTLRWNGGHEGNTYASLDDIKIVYY